jgi:hypothetical protein
MLLEFPTEDEWNPLLTDLAGRIWAMTSPKGRILYAEDNADTRDLVTYVLSHEGHEVTCTNSTDQTLALAETNPLTFTY